MNQHHLRKELTVLSWNLNLVPFIPSNKSKRIKHISEAIHKMSPDIICFQEVYTFISYLKLKNALQRNYPFCSSMPEKGTFKAFNSGLVIFSKYPIRNEIFKSFTSLSGIDSLYSKGIQICTIQKTNILNTALQSGTSSQKVGLRKKNLDQLIKSIKHYINPNFIFCGDFRLNLTSIKNTYLTEQLNLKKVENLLKGENSIFIVEGSRLKQNTYEEVVCDSPSQMSPFSPTISNINYPVELAEDLHHLK
jgi:exonuclease III